MTTDDLRITAWSLRCTAGTSRALETTWTQDGSPFDLDGHTVVLTVGGVPQALVASGNVATITLVAPDAVGETPLRLLLDGVLLTTGNLLASNLGTNTADLTLDVNVGSIAVAIEVLGGQSPDAVIWPSS